MFKLSFESGTVLLFGSSNVLSLIFSKLASFVNIPLKKESRCEDKAMGSFSGLRLVLFFLWLGFILLFGGSGGVHCCCLF